MDGNKFRSGDRHDYIHLARKWWKVKKMVVFHYSVSTFGGQGRDRWKSIYSGDSLRIDVVKKPFLAQAGSAYGANRARLGRQPIQPFSLDRLNATYLVKNKS